MLSPPPASAWKQALIVVGLAALVAVRWWAHTVWPGPMSDEAAYLRAIDFVLDGKSPYTVGNYLYPPFLAVTGAALVELIGVDVFFYLLRALNYLGIAITVWLSLLAVRWRRWFLPAAAAVLCLAPPIWFGVEIHNISLAISGTALLALWIWPQRPIVAGILLGSCAVIKPMVFLVPFLLAAHRPAGGGHRHRIAGGVGIAVAGLLLVLPPYFTDMLSLATKSATIPRSVSLHRLAHVAGWEHNALWVSAAIGLIALIIVLRTRLDRIELLVVAVTASLMATPVVWSHTLVITFPIQALALQRLHRRHRDGRLAFRAEPIFILLTIATLQLSGGATGIDDQAAALQVFGTLPVALAPLIAALYLMRTGGCGEAGRSRRADPEDPRLGATSR